MRWFFGVLVFSAVLWSVLGQAAPGEPLVNPVVPNARLGEFRHGTLVKSGPDGIKLAASPEEATHTHVGVDLVAPCGSPIYPFADGKIREVIASQDDRDYPYLGYMVLIEHPDTLLGKPFFTLYLHMQNPPSVAPDQPVVGGKTLLGVVGDTGRADGCHTHFEVRYFRFRYFSGWCRPRCNIYGPGDQRNAEAFKRNWEDPLGQFSNQAAALTVATAEEKPLDASTAASDDIVKIKDGTVLMGTIETSIIPFKTSYGDIDVCTDDIIEFDGNFLTLKDHSKLKGRFQRGTITVTTPRGSLSFPAVEVVSIRKSSAETAEAGTPSFPSVIPEAGQGIIVGQVLDAFGMPLEGALVSIEGTTFKTTTDASGKYSIPYVPGRIKLSISKSNHVSVDLSFDIAAASTFPAQQIVLYKIPPNQGIWLIGGFDYIPLKRGKITDSQSGSHNRYVTYYAAGSFTFLERSGKLVFIDTDPNLIWLLKITSQNNTFLLIDYSRGILEGEFKGIKIETKDTNIAEGIFLREANLEKGRYVFVTIGGNLLALPKEPIYLFEISDYDQRVSEEFEAIKRKIEVRKSILPENPEYLMTTDTISGAIATVWMDLTTKWLSEADLRVLYEEFYYTSFDYRGMMILALIRAERALYNEELHKADTCLMEADRYLKLFNLNNEAAIAVYNNNIDVAYELAKSIYQASKASVKYGADVGKVLIGPWGSATVDLIFMTTDFLVDSGELGLNDASRKLVKSALVDVFLNDVHIPSLGGQTLSQFLSKKTTKIIGSSVLYPILNEIIDSPEFQKSFMTILARSGAHISTELVNNMTRKMLEEFSNKLNKEGAIMPPMSYQDYGACPFECCLYREWTAKKETFVRMDAESNSSILYKIAKDESATAVTGVVITTTPGQAKVLRPFIIGSLRVDVSETVYVLTYQGEGLFAIWYKGNVWNPSPDIDNNIYVRDSIEIIKAPKSVWWVQFKNSKGQIGWSDETDNFDNKDACG